VTSIFHIVSREAWAAAQAAGEYRGDTLATEGFIHCSRSEQVAAVANAFYAGQTHLALLRIDRGRVTAEVRDEASGDEVFPHIYGPLNLDAVAEVMAFAPGADGRFSGPGQS
jgi:uncharacterized protein (DUF952 family)